VSNGPKLCRYDDLVFSMKYLAAVLCALLAVGAVGPATADTLTPPRSTIVAMA
jgi:hypothetical protein